MDGKMERAAKIRRERLYKSLDDLQRLTERRTTAKQNLVKSNDMAKVLSGHLPYLVSCRVLSHVLSACTFVCLFYCGLFVSSVLSLILMCPVSSRRPCLTPRSTTQFPTQLLRFLSNPSHNPDSNRNPNPNTKPKPQPSPSTRSTCSSSSDCSTYCGRERRTILMYGSSTLSFKVSASLTEP